MGHSIPPRDRMAFIIQIKTMCQTPVLALYQPYEPPLKFADYHFNSDDPERLIGYVRAIIKDRAIRRFE
jgi:hypothetical protein